MIKKFNYFFLLNLNPWPLISSLNSFSMMASLLMFMKFGNTDLMKISMTNLMLSSVIWWILYSSEFNLQGNNSFNLEQGLKFSMILFISSEVFFFFSFFWSYFHFFISPMVEVGMAWPPTMMQAFDSTNVPLINTFLLLTSGITVTISHAYLIKGDLKTSNKMLALTLFLGLNFTALQLMEYKTSLFTMSDSTFGTTFFVLTGFHGIHVMIGSIFLSVALMRSIKISSSTMEYLSFEMASWYWHFVDVVWIFLYFLLYYMNN